MLDLAKMNGSGCLSQTDDPLATDDLLAPMNQPDFRSLYWSTTPLWEDFCRNAECGRQPGDIKREMYIPYAWIPIPLGRNCLSQRTMNNRGSRDGAKRSLDPFPSEPSPR